jgi:hypothetical protein
MSEQEDNQALHHFCLEWANWHRTRKLYAPPPPKNILARLIKPSSGEEPDARIDRDMLLFNTALNSYPEGIGKTAFYVFYLYHARPVKRAAEKIGLSRNGFYKAMRRTRQDVFAMYQRLAKEAVRNVELS